MEEAKSKIKGKGKVPPRKVIHVNEKQKVWIAKVPVSISTLLIKLPYLLLYKLQYLQLVLFDLYLIYAYSI